MKKMFLFGFVFIVVSTLHAQTSAIENGGQFRVMGIREVISTNMFITPGENMRFVAFDILIDNSNGENDIRLGGSSRSIEIRDAEGFSYTPNLMSSTLAEPAMALNTIIEAGDFIRGWITVAIRNEATINGLRIRLRANTGQSGWVVIQQ